MHFTISACVCVCVYVNKDWNGMLASVVEPPSGGSKREQ